jgi:hypothetical protein
MSRLATTAAPGPQDPRLGQNALRLPRSPDGAQRNPGQPLRLTTDQWVTAATWIPLRSIQATRGNSGETLLHSRSQALRGNAVPAAPAARGATRRWSVGACSHAGAWEPEGPEGRTGPSHRSRSHAPRGNAVLAAPAARAATRRWSLGACSHAGAWEQEEVAA